MLKKPNFKKFKYNIGQEFDLYIEDEQIKLEIIGQKLEVPYTYNSAWYKPEHIKYNMIYYVMLRSGKYEFIMLTEENLELTIQKSKDYYNAHINPNKIK